MLDIKVVEKKPAVNAATAFILSDHYGVTVTFCFACIRCALSASDNENGGTKTLVGA